MVGLNRVQSRLRDLGRTIHRRVRGWRKRDTGLFDPAEGRVLVGSGGGTGSWVGAPSMLVEDGEIYLALRWRGPRRRGHRSAIVQVTDDGVDEILSFGKEAFDACSLEGAALGREGGEYVLYQSYQPSPSSWWRVDRLTAGNLSGFDRADRERVLDGHGGHLKDPVLHDGRLYLHAPSRLFRSCSTLVVGDDTIVGRLSYGRDADRSPRLTSVIDVQETSLALYDWRPSWSHVGAERSRYGRLTGDAVVPLVGEDATIRSENGDGAVRYVNGAVLDGEAVLVYERGAADGSHDLCVSRLPVEDVADCLRTGR
jgi:hypothetical protein